MTVEPLQDLNAPPQQEYLAKDEWHPEEDLLIIALVHKFGTKAWKKLAIDLNQRFSARTQKRTGKECRERWVNALDLSNRKSVWTEQEEEAFIKAHKVHGNKWTKISAYIPGRNDGYLKNHFYSTVRTIMSKVKTMDFPRENIETKKARKNLAYYLKYMRDAINFIGNYQRERR
mmetsp:Transcript_41916/g.64154  ORF Transcript_41916/g.64154 Transcript_41916/m.64154 type:complete len:174 (-) Transcript_41916:1115-1636(-)|eukprot:CAMPEP_0170509848 /NCGR_PEP_ID=MMETSP0208-20121228/65433_1 /TAXON_ID=197538 /ORGANISM="Strombidium inclinatum, Strain S3" /LENGTH=173 /DNA_ID=CAMNT_0010793247 /DNA_START=563 /DNA_END=1084 /DNA_ORIENTATION=+